MGQHSKRIDPSLGSSTSWGREKEKEEELHHSKENQTQEEEGEIICAEILQGRREWQITRLRRECPSESCGAGVFMAQHFDRQYCGKCCLTYVFAKPGEGAK